MHVDAASGGFVAPFLQPELEWDFRLPRVTSINASGHKYGLVYPGVGWAVWRDEEALPQELVFDVNYLGGNMPTFALNFSRPGSEVIVQYWMLASQGREGYRRIMQGAQDVATLHLERDRRHGALPAASPRVASCPCSPSPCAEEGNYTVFDVSERLRTRGWLVPAYTFPENRQDFSVLRIVVRAGMTHEMADLLLEQLAGTDEVPRVARSSDAGARPGPAKGLRPQLSSALSAPGRARRSPQPTPGPPPPGRPALRPR